MERNIERYCDPKSKRRTRDKRIIAEVAGWFAVLLFTFFVLWLNVKHAEFFDKISEKSGITEERVIQIEDRLDFIEGELKYLRN